MKISVTTILKDHLKTLRQFPSTNVSPFDVAIFYGIPFICAITSYLLGMSVKIDFYNVSITFFGIFIALLLNIQVAIFSIFLRKWDPNSEGKSLESIATKLKERKLLLGEINSNVSYLILLSCGALVIFLIAFTWSLLNGVLPSISVFIYAHFMLTLLMVIKRTHAIFQKEYS